MVKALLALFGQCWPRSLSIGELTQAVAELTADGGPAAGAAAATREAVVLNVVQFLAAGIIDPSGTPDRFTTTVSLRPQASRLSRHQAQTSPRITNARHETVCLDETSRQLLALLDGTRDQQALLEALVQAIERGEFSAPLGGAEPRVLVNSLQQWLTALAGQALLVS